ncbi:MAG TPA: hypothetical protein PKJ21_07545 [Anaerolineae bacterium]|mgnify:FL=1|nr:hypothetical protein [Anaerolineae bacterium]HNT06012.1 hypothetical protein [Anaerolineae bacterium]HOU24434.1 hypothetical protein [Anaerolineae bacterium]HQJ51803.1 hypothetical protein [Anaerolineae bacterium]
MAVPLAVEAGLTGRISGRFLELVAQAGRRGAIAFTGLEGVELMPEQRQRLNELLEMAGLRPPVLAAALAVFYHPGEVQAIPAVWPTHPQDLDQWNRYARAYHEVNRVLNDICERLALEFSGVAEKATIDGWAGSVSNVKEYFPHCVSHRAFAEAAGLGWRGKHGLIVTPEAGPALRLATLFVSGEAAPEARHLRGCGTCRACLDLCPLLPREGAQTLGRKGGDYRERCRRRISRLGLEADVCGVCVRVCWESVTGKRAGATPAQNGT